MPAARGSLALSEHKVGVSTGRTAGAGQQNPGCPRPTRSRHRGAAGHCSQVVGPDGARVVRPESRHGYHLVLVTRRDAESCSAHTSSCPPVLFSARFAPKDLLVLRQELLG